MFSLWLLNCICFGGVEPRPLMFREQYQPWYRTWQPCPRSPRLLGGTLLLELTPQCLLAIPSPGPVQAASCHSDCALEQISHSVFLTLNSENGPFSSSCMSWIFFPFSFFTDSFVSLHFDLTWNIRNGNKHKKWHESVVMEWWERTWLVFYFYELIYKPSYFKKAMETDYRDCITRCENFLGENKERKSVKIWVILLHKIYLNI